MTDFVKGQRVEITRIIEVSTATKYGVYDEHGILHPHKEWSMKILEPAYWPPQPGDVWETRDEDYMVYNLNGRVTIRAKTQTISQRVFYNTVPRYATDNPGDFDAFKQLNPVLRFRSNSESAK